MPKTKSSYPKLRPETIRMINGAEGYDVEFKENASGLETEDIVAFANGRGGIILIGVQEIGKKRQQKGQIVGCEISDRAKRSILDKANNCDPKIDINIIAEGIRTKTPIYRLEIPASDRKPHCTRGGTYKIRKDGQNIGIDLELIKTMIFEKEEKEFISRFKAAGDEILKTLKELGAGLDEKIDNVASIASEAASSAEQAAASAEEAAGAAAENIK